MSWRRALSGCAALALCIVGAPPARAEAGAPHIVVGAKKFTEGAILGELMAQILETQTDAIVERRFNLAGTQIRFRACARALACGRNTPAPTARYLPILAGAAPVFAQVSRAFRERFDLVWLALLVSNTYVLMMQRNAPRSSASRH
jgi:glycine betaine/choline ABC-type transport system substrate-binding protein